MPRMPAVFGYAASTYTLMRETATAYTGFIPPSVTLSTAFTSGYLEVTLDQLRTVSITLVGNTTTVLNFDDELTKVTDMEFTNLSSITTDIGAEQGGLSVLITDDAGRPIEDPTAIDINVGYFANRSRPIGFYNQGIVVQSDATLLAAGVRPQQKDVVYVSGATFTVVRSDETVDYTGQSYYRMDLTRLGWEDGV